MRNPATPVTAVAAEFYNIAPVIRPSSRALTETTSPCGHLENIMALENLDKLFLDELKDVYNAEKQILTALPKMARAAESSGLAEAFTSHLTETEGHVSRLEQIFEMLGQPARGKKCKGMEGLLAEGKEILEEEGDASVIDAALISAAQRVEHYEMAAYGCLRSYAELLGHAQAVTLLDQTLAEEEAADQKLTELADQGINEAALAAGRGSEKK